MSCFGPGSDLSPHHLAFVAGVLRINKVGQKFFPLLQGAEGWIFFRWAGGFFSHPTEDCLNVCAVCDPVGYIKTAVLRHRAVPPWSSGVWQQPGAARVCLSHFAGELEPGLVLVRHNNDMSRIEVPAVPLRSEAAGTTNRGHSRQSHLAQGISTGFALDEKDVRRAICQSLLRLSQSEGNDPIQNLPGA